MKRTVNSLMPLTLLLLLLSACAPAASGDWNRVALINGPGEHSLPALAGKLGTQLQKQPGCCPFGFLRDRVVQNQAQQRNLYGSRAGPQAAALGQNLHARWPVLVGTEEFKRSVEERNGDYRIHGAVSVRAVLIDVTDGTELAAVTSAVFSGSRWQPAERELPGEKQDPLLNGLAAEAAAELAPALLDLLLAATAGSNP